MTPRGRTVWWVATVDLALLSGMEALTFARFVPAGQTQGCFHCLGAGSPLRVSVLPGGPAQHRDPSCMCTVITGFSR